MPWIGWSPCKPMRATSLAPWETSRNLGTTVRNLFTGVTELPELCTCWPGGGFSLKLAPTCTCWQSAPDLGRQRDRVHASSCQGGQSHVEEVGQSANCPVSLLTSQRFAEEGPRTLPRRCRLWLRLLAHVQADKVTN